jgi:hypothetical protein
LSLAGFLVLSSQFIEMTIPRFIIYAKCSGNEAVIDMNAGTIIKGAFLKGFYVVWK